MLNITAIQWCLANTYILKKTEKNFSFGYFFISWLVNLLPFSCQEEKKTQEKNPKPQPNKKNPSTST